MRIQKIVDTVSNFGRAEQFIMLDADFVRFLRDQYKRKEIKEVSADEIAKKYRLRGLVFGNYVTQEERFFFLFKIAGQLEILAKLKGNNNLGKDVLVVAFGVEGKPRANAHYNPRKQTDINKGRMTHQTLCA